MRGLFTAGILDVMLENGLVFDGGIGVSAGAAFGCNYKSKQIGRAIRYNLRFCRDWRYASLRSWITTGDLYGADFCYRTIPEELDPFDCETYAANPMEFYVVCTDVYSGEPVYHSCPAIGRTEIMWIQASASMPLVSRPVKIGAQTLLDGGMSDSIPLRAFEERGYERNVVILTQPLGYIKKANPLMPLLRIVHRRYKGLLDSMAKRHITYNEQTAYAARREKEGAALVLRPPRPLPIHHVDHNERHLRETYAIGRQTGTENLPKIKEFLGQQ